MTTSWQALPGVSTPCQNDRVPNRQVRASEAKRCCSAPGGVLALQQHRQVGRRAHGRGRPGRRGGRAEQPERAPAGRLHQLDEQLVDRRRPGHRHAARVGQVAAPPTAGPAAA